MRILFISNDLIGGNIAHVLKKEGNEVKLFIEEDGRKQNFTNLVEKTNNWRSELEWVGKDGLIVFDDIGYGKAQDQLRKRGYSVFGGSALGDRLETDRQYAQEIFREAGMKLVPTRNFKDIDSAIDFVKENKGPWVIKQNGHAAKGLNYVSNFEDGRDTINMLENYAKHLRGAAREITLQKRIVGIEIAVTRYFNGNDWIGPMLINIEHKKFFPGDMGPTTSEMGTLGWYDDKESNKLYKETLAKIKPHLQKIDYRGHIDINCIVNGEGAFPLEATARIGSPIIHLQTELNISPWCELMKAIADGKPYELRYKNGVGIVVLIAVPPFPYSKYINSHKFYGVKVFFDGMTAEDWSHVHFEELSSHEPFGDEYYISDNRGYVLYTTGSGATAEIAAGSAYSLAKKIFIPKMFYRNDIGSSFVNTNRNKLQNWGYL